MLVECGFTRAQAPDGAEWSFTPSLARIASLGSPTEIVELYAALHGPRAAETATDVLACLCDQEDATPLIGWVDETGRHPGAMPAAERVIFARHLMQHGIVGVARPGASAAPVESGRYSERFDAAEYIAAACVHLGLARSDAEAISMTEFQRMFAMKFPEAAKANGAREVPTREEYDSLMSRLGAKAGGHG